MTIEGLRIREAELRDIRRLAEIEKACFEDGYSEEILAFFLTSPKHVCLVAEVNGIIVGLAIGGLELEESGPLIGHVWTLEVVAPYRRRGIGALLLSRLEEALRTRGARECYLEVRADNEPAIRLYEKAGYRRDRLLRDYYGPGKNGLLMKKPLI